MTAEEEKAMSGKGKTQKSAMNTLSPHLRDKIK